MGVLPSLVHAAGGDEGDFLLRSGMPGHKEAPVKALLVRAHHVQNSSFVFNEFGQGHVAAALGSRRKKERVGWRAISFIAVAMSRGRRFHWIIVLGMKLLLAIKTSKCITCLSDEGTTCTQEAKLIGV